MSLPQGSSCRFPLSSKPTRSRRTTCAISMPMTRWYPSSWPARPEPSRSRRSSLSCSRCTPTPRSTASPSCSASAVALLASLVNDTGDTQVVNVRNNGTMPFLPDDAVIEVASVIGRHGAAPLGYAPLSPLKRGLTAHVSAYEELAVQAARLGGGDRVFEAMLAHPLIGQYDKAGQLTDLLLAENAAFLPWADGGADGGSGAPATASGR